MELELAEQAGANARQKAEAHRSRVAGDMARALQMLGFVSRRRRSRPFSLPHEARETKGYHHSYHL